MRFLIDENVSVKVLHWLSTQGHDAVRIPGGTKNGQVVALALKDSRILLTHDHDFADRLRYPPPKHAGIILIEIHPPRLSNLMSALQKLLSTPPEGSFNGKLCILQEKGYHVIS